jgi:hypothetical protein
MSHDENKEIVGQHYGLQAIINCCKEIDRRVFNSTLCWMNPDYEPAGLCSYQTLSEDKQTYVCNKYYKLNNEVRP